VKGSSPNDRTSSTESEEIGGFQAALDKVYAKLRERAANAWAVRVSEKNDPADACANVRIAASGRTSKHRLEARGQLDQPLSAKKARARKPDHHRN
jgi:hypothetical protein